MPNCEHKRRMLVGEFPRQIGNGLYSWRYICRDCGYQGEEIAQCETPEEFDEYRRKVEGGE